MRKLQSRMENLRDYNEKSNTDSQRSLRGEYIALKSSETPVAFSSGLVAGKSLPSKIKKMIVDDKYVDFFDILYTDAENTYTLSLQNSDSNPYLNLKPRKKRRLTTIEWLRAFDDYLSVYTSKHPSQLSNLITYSKFIKGLMAKNHDWLYYDTHFRKDREHSRCSWTQVRIDLQIASAKYTSQNNTTTPGYNQSNRIPSGFCFSYHSRYERCQHSDCKYKHSCPNCEKNHPMFICYHRNSRQQRWEHQTRKTPVKTTNTNQDKQAGYNAKRL